MNSNGMKRGLAVSAISALAVAGLPLLAGVAHAEPISSNYAAGVDLVTGEVAVGGRWDSSPDGQDSRVHLVAAAAANVQEVQFEYRPAGDATWHNIDRVAVVNGIAQVFWDTTGVPLGNVTVRATGWNANNNI